MVAWSTKRQLTILGVIIIVLSIPVSYALFSVFYQTPTCFDGKQNQEEIGVDCGGSCARQCTSQVAELIVKWSRALEVLPGVYDTVAFVENPNFTSGIKKIRYSFTLFDKNNIVVAERRGETYVNPNEQFVVFESGIETGERLPVRTFFEFSEEPQWIKIKDDKPIIQIKNATLSDNTVRPRLDATVVNSSLQSVQDVSVVALLFDKYDNVIAASKTKVDFLPKGISKDVVFTWPRKFKHKPEVCVVPLDVVLVFDRSGSMNDDSDNPPQPLTNAKEAAQSFVDTLSKEDQIGVVSFATEASTPIDQALTNKHTSAKGALKEISIPPKEEVGFTNLGDAILKATKELTGARGNSDAKRIMVVLTDGLANMPEDPGGEIYAYRQARIAKREDVIVYSIGLGDDVNELFLEEKISSKKERYYSAKESSDLLRVYKEISQVVCPERTYPMNILPRLNIVK